MAASSDADVADVGVSVDVVKRGGIAADHVVGVVLFGVVCGRRT